MIEIETRYKKAKEKYKEKTLSKESFARAEELFNQAKSIFEKIEKK